MKLLMIILLALSFITSCNPNANKTIKDNINKSVEDINSARDGGWSPWQDYTRCLSIDAGQNKIQIRFCSNPSPTNGGSPCVGEQRRTVSCAATTETGKFSNWTNVGVCNLNTGQQKQTRVCLNHCVGKTSRYINCKVDGGLGPAYRIKSCSLFPNGNHYEVWRRDCNQPLPRNGGKSCPQDPVIEERSCTPVEGPTPRPEGCQEISCLPIHGGWSDWKIMSSCIQGQQQEVRECNNPTPANGGDYCSGPISRLVSCDEGCVAIATSYVGVCDSYNTTRTKITTYQGGRCEQKETRESIPCPVDCVWGDYVPLNPELGCDVKRGTETLIRKIKTHPSNGGRECGTPEVRVVDCPIQNTGTCAIN